jgi:hypothetical protein
MNKFAADYVSQPIATKRIISALDAGLLLRYSLTIVGDIRFSINYFWIFPRSHDHTLMFDHLSYSSMPSDEALICHSCTLWQNSLGQRLPLCQMCGMRIIGMSIAGN